MPRSKGRSEAHIFGKGFSTKSSYNLSGDSKPLFSSAHTPDTRWTTRIQIGKTRFHRVERAIDWIRMRFNKPKFNADNLK